jgi:hypothetical protein
LPLILANYIRKLTLNLAPTFRRMSQHAEKFGPVAAVPIIGPNAGSMAAKADPLSPENIAAAALKQQVQATADTKYDPAVPPPVAEQQGSIQPDSQPTIEKFTTIYENNIVGGSFLVLGLILLHSCLKQYFA